MATLATKTLCARLRALGVPKLQTKQILSDISRWVSSSGEEWTVERLKTMKQAYIMKMAGQPFSTRLFKLDKNGNPKGVWKWIFKRPHFQALNILMSYSCFTSQFITKKQRTKFFSSMESTDTRGTNARLAPFIEAKFATLPEPDLITDYYHKTTRCPTFGGSQSCQNVVDQMVLWAQTALGTYVMTQLPEVVNKSLPGGTHMMSHFGLHMSNLDELTLKGVSPETGARLRNCVGKISVIQEPGFKLRAVASPNIVWQVILSPLNKILQKALKAFPGDCTFDQESGFLRVQEWLQQGKTLHSVDLSDATNTFPRNIQFKLIRESLQIKDETEQKMFSALVDIFELVSSAPWFFKENKEVTFHRFKRGQPLGLIPSFASFAYAHNTLVSHLALKVFKGDRDKALNTYVILGDDIVIADNEVARLYKETMRNLGCTISVNKTITSNVVAEFAGKVITQQEAISTYKWKPVVGENFIAMTHQMGRNAMGLLNRSQRKVVKLLSEVPEFISPGFGWNPKGRTLEERLSTPLALALAKSPCDDVTEVLRPIAPDIGRIENDLNKAGLHVDSSTHVELCGRAEGDQPLGNWSHASFVMYKRFVKKDLLRFLDYAQLHRPEGYQTIRDQLFRRIGDWSPGDPRHADSLRQVVRAFSPDHPDRVALLHALGLVRTHRLNFSNPILFKENKTMRKKRQRRHRLKR